MPILKTKLFLILLCNAFLSCFSARNGFVNAREREEVIKISGYFTKRKERQVSKENFLDASRSHVRCLQVVASAA
jgi:hypothetical protein